MTVDFLDPAQTGVFQALAQDMPPHLAQVFQHVPQDVQGDYVVVGEIEEDDAGTKGDPRSLIGVEIHSIHRGPGRAPLLAIMQAVKEILTDHHIVADGVAFEPIRFLGAAASGVGPDGMTYAGISNFEFFGEGDD